jgi:F-type H+-transporting ATPase subunit b
MKIPGQCGNNLSRSSAAILIVIALMLFLIATPAYAASEGGGTHWQKTDWARVLNFTILAVALYIVLRKPISQALNNRIKGIKEELEDLESRKSMVEKQLVDYKNKLALLDKEAEQIVAEYIRQGEEAKARILTEASAAADKLKEQARKNIEHEFAQAKLELQSEIVDQALAKAEAVIRKQIGDADQERLVDDYLAKVVA